MPITFDIPAEMQRRVEAIPGLNRRVVQFLRHEAALEVVRQRRHSLRAREVVERALACAEADKAGGFAAGESFDELLALHEKITAQL